MHKRLAFVDTLRGIAVLSVVLQHTLEQIVLNQPTGTYFWAFHYALGEYFNFGRFGVVLFFFVSGFVIPYSFPNSAAPVRDFAISRFFRLYPAYWLSIVVLLVLSPAIEGKTFLSSHVLANMTMFQMFMGIPNIRIAYWTLTVELIFYVSCICLFATGFLTRRLTALQIVIATCVIGIVAFPVVKSHAVWGVLELALDLTAMFFGKVIRDTVMEGKLNWRHVGICALLYVIFAAGVTYRRYGIDYQENFFCAYGMGAAYIVAAFVFIGFAAFGEKAAWRFMSFVGMISYSIYLMGSFAMIVIFYYSGAGSGPVQWLLFTVAVIAASILVSWLTYLAVEKPSIRFGQRFRSPRAFASVSLQSPLRSQVAE
ncbi:acyltransferase [Bradyrhizobium sp. WYCCWR 13023]|uniref:Acyltransferase n=1 Tax=Bradyrhizobium zhengyangense TaxID=2911009 RepID=A0A9X1RFA7_9BRAD|nr:MULTISPECIES: acyltransferase [Bradyrhizobium]MCG2631521.1 acyltransferase [Bradyrhizobium zhengyangense]MCG2671381.1 acyltransferase [Bradyrhizobium zhengyangense]MDA9522848.1 acyltransferase [Bradyrhizobium sp. CCBAU 11434]